MTTEPLPQRFGPAPTPEQISAWERWRHQRARALTAATGGPEEPVPADVTPEELFLNERAALSPGGIPQPVNEADRVNQWWYQNHVPRNSENAHLFHFPPPYALTGPFPNKEHYHVAAVLQAAGWAKLEPTLLPGLVLDLSGPMDRYFVTFEETEPIGQHLFVEASGGGYVFNARECGGRLAAVVEFRAHLGQLRKPWKAL